MPTPGIEPGSTVLQTAAMTTFAKLALVLSTRIELVIHPYQGCVIPLNYESMVPCEGIEPPSDPCKGPALPLDEQGETWCEWRESNPQAEAADFKSAVFADFTTLAIYCNRYSDDRIIYNMSCQKDLEIHIGHNDLNLLFL